MTNKPQCYAMDWAMWDNMEAKVNGLAMTIDALPSHGGETQVRVSQSQVAELGLGSTLPASNSRKG
jgi:hypothetical protein